MTLVKVKDKNVGFLKTLLDKNIFNLQEGGAVLCPSVVKVVVILAFSIVI